MVASRNLMSDSLLGKYSIEEDTKQNPTGAVQNLDDEHGFANDRNTYGGGAAPSGSIDWDF